VVISGDAVVVAGNAVVYLVVCEVAGVVWEVTMVGSGDTAVNVIAAIVLITPVMVALVSTRYRA